MRRKRPTADAVSADAHAQLALWLAQLEARQPERMKLGLGRVRAILDHLDLPRPLLVITIAGTNGKGSTARLLDRLLGAAGYRVGRYTSPHLSHFNERIMIAGQPAGDAALVSAFARVAAAEATDSLSYFEFVTVAALVAFSAAACDALVLEIGLGGRLDAVNAVDPDVAILTNVALDHQRWLGATLDEIGAEKAAIFRRARPAIVGSREPPTSVTAHLRSIGAHGLRLGVDFDWHDADDGTWRWVGSDLSLTGLPAAIDGAEQDTISGVLAALAAADVLRRLDPATIRRHVGQARPPGRLERREGRHTLLLDVAHNAASVGRLADYLSRHAHDKPVTLVFGAMADKDIEAMLAQLVPFVARWIAVAAPLERALPSDRMAAQMALASGRPALDAGSALAGLQRAATLTPAGGWIVVAGSFPIVGSIRAAL